MLRTTLVLGLVGLVAAPASGQSLNIDYNDAAGSPTADYAAAGVPGVWNTLIGDGGAVESLVGLRGQPLAATVVRGLASALDGDDPSTSGDDEALLDDAVGGMGDVVVLVTFDDLVDGDYEVLVYAWAAEAPTETTLVFLEDAVVLGQVIGGPWPGGLEEGVTHAVFEIPVTGGSFTLSVVGGFFGASGYLNGIQLRRLTPSDLNEDGIVDVFDLLELLGNWGPCPPGPPCAGDTNLDGVVDVLDLLDLLAEWG